MRLSSVLFACCLLTIAPAAIAGPDDGSPAGRALALKERGNQSMLDMRYVDALSAYEQSLALSPEDVTLLYSLARAHELLGDFPQALAALERFTTEAPPSIKARVGKLDDLLAELRRRVSTLVLKCNVKGARVLVRHKVVGATPFAAPARLNAGGATIEVELEGFFPQTRDVVLPGGGALELEITLSPKSTSGLLVVKTQPSGSRVWIDGKVEGTSTPSLELSLAAGPHRVAAKREGYDDADSPVVLQAGATRQVTLTLEPSVSIARRWWFWTGVGVVVAGGAAFTAAMLIEKSPKQGSLAPGQVTAPAAMRGFKFDLAPAR